MSDSYAKAYTEVLEIISHFSEDELKKIPQEEIDFYNEAKDKSYQFKIDSNRDLDVQNISREANAILILLFREYFATEKQKQVLDDLLQQNEIKEENEKREKYNPDNIFKNIEKKEKLKAEIPENNSDTALIEYKESFFTKFKNFIFRILHIN